MKPIRCDIPNSLYAALNQRAAADGVSRDHLIVDALAKHLGQPLHTLFQVSTSAALVEGLYQGAVQVARLLRHGDFGLGTFVDLAGEMVVLDGVCYQIDPSGAVTTVEGERFIPYAVVTRFTAENSKPYLQIASFGDLVAACDALRTSANLFYAFRIEGRFASVKTRVMKAVTAGTGLKEAANAQEEFVFNEIDGGFVGRKVVVGFVDDDDRTGGLVLDEADDLRFRRHGPRRVVRVTNIEASDVVGRLEHGVDVIGAGGKQGHAMDLDVHLGARAGSLLIAGLTNDEVLAAEEAGVDREIERATRTRVQSDIAFAAAGGFGQAVHLGEGGDGFSLVLTVVAAAFTADLGDRRAGVGGRTEGVFIGADDDGERVDDAFAEITNVTHATTAAALGGGVLGESSESGKRTSSDRRGSDGAHKASARKHVPEIIIHNAAPRIGEGA